jgi:hypothetical protein
MRYNLHDAVAIKYFASRASLSQTLSCQAYCIRSWLSLSGPLHTAKHWPFSHTLWDLPDESKNCAKRAPVQVWRSFPILFPVFWWWWPVLFSVLAIHIIFSVQRYRSGGQAGVRLSQSISHNDTLYPG